MISDQERVDGLFSDGEKATHSYASRTKNTKQ